jgi:hypothetical protein
MSIQWRCLACGDTFESDPTRHSMDYCDCGGPWVDHERSYIRRSMNVTPVMSLLNINARYAN